MVFFFAYTPPQVGLRQNHPKASGVGGHNNVCND